MRAAPYLSAALAVAVHVPAAQVDWSQAGGSTGRTAGSMGIAAQGYDTRVSTASGKVLQPGFLAHPRLHNSAPFVATPFDDLAEPNTFAPVKLALGAHFADPDGDALTGSCSVEGTVATCQVVGDTLVVSGADGQVGAGKIDVSVSDGSRTASDTFAIEVASSSIRRPAGAGTRKGGSPDARIARVFAQVAQGSAAGDLGPGADCGDGGCLAVDLLLTGPSDVSVSVFDHLGTPVISWSRDVGSMDLQGIVPDAEGRRAFPLVWNLRSGNGTAVPAGVYLWKIQVHGVDGSKLETVRRMGVQPRR
jgi:hypothetical protein